MRTTSRHALAGCLLSAQAALAAPFDVYRTACLDTGVEATRIRTAAGAWSALTEAEREVLAPGNGRSVEGWAIVRDGARHLVSISTRPAGAMAGDRAASIIVSCSVLAPKADEAGALRAYTDFLKRQPSSTDRFDGMSTYTWSIQGQGGMTLHYLVSGGSLPGLSLSVSSIRN
ncbi:MAG: hypothetical protein ACK6A4_05650 [Alphaproteobacteria bacterium]